MNSMEGPMVPFDERPEQQQWIERNSPSMHTRELDNNSIPEKKPRTLDMEPDQYFASQNYDYHTTQYLPNGNEYGTDAYNGESNYDLALYQEKDALLDYGENWSTDHQSQMPTSDATSDDMQHSTSKIGGANFSDLLRELGQESKMVVLQYSQTFGDSEAFEQQVSQCFDDLKQHTLLIEQDITQKKKELHNKLKKIMSILSIESHI